MEVIFPWERDDIVVRSTAEDSSDGASDGSGFASVLMALSRQADDEARIRTLADGVRTVASSTDTTTDEVLARVESILEEDETVDAE